MKLLKLPVLNKNGQGDFKSTKRSEFRQTANFILTVKKRNFFFPQKLRKIILKLLLFNLILLYSFVFLTRTHVSVSHRNELIHFGADFYAVSN